MQAPTLRPVIPCQYGAKPEQIIVACVFWGDKYPLEYVKRLYSMVRRHLTIPFRFACLTDQEVCIPGIERYRTRHDWPGWWQKVALFNPDQFAPGRRVLYLDLDVVISGSLDWLAAVDEPFACVENFSPNRERSPHNSSVMVWEAGHPTPSRIFNEFDRSIIDELHGDQCYIWRRLDSIPNLPRDRIQSFKYDTLRGKQGGCVTIFHGKPDPHEVSDHPHVAEHWR